MIGSNYKPNNILINSCQVEVVKEIKHLGIYMSAKSHSIYKFNEIIHDMKIKSNATVSNFYKLHTDSKIEIFKAQCHSLYGCSLLDLDCNSLEKLKVCWRQCCRKILNLPQRTRSKLIPNLMSSCEITDILQQRMINFYIGGLSHENLFIRNCFYNTVIGSHSFALRNLNIIIRNHKIDYFNIFHGRKVKFKQTVCDEQWRINILKELIDIRDFNRNNILDRNEILHLLNYLCTF